MTLEDASMKSRPIGLRDYFVDAPCIYGTYIELYSLPSSSMKNINIQLLQYDAVQE